jgi:mannosyltransferase OCH1-like enzyme
MKCIKKYIKAETKSHYGKCQMIPRKIFQTMETNCVPVKMKNAAESWSLKNPDYEYNFFDNNDRREFLKKFFWGRTFEAYHCIDYGAAKSDLWRYCILYIYGGVYIDIDSICEMPMSSLIKPNDTFIVPKGRVERTLASGFLCSIPKHDFLKKAIEIATDNILSRMEGTSTDVVGPFCSAAAVEQTTNKKLTELKLGLNEINGYSFRLLKERKKEEDHCHCAYDEKHNKVLTNQYAGYLDDCQTLKTNRKKTHKDSKMYKDFGFNVNKIQLEITVACNLKCFNCNQQCQQAPSTDHLSLEQIKEFVKESISLKWDWKQIDIMGGEPTLHPKLNQIIEELSKLDCKVRLLTNGYGKHIDEVLSKIPEWVEIKDTMKESPYQENFTLINKAPIDYGIKGVVCRIPKTCGLMLTKFGFYAASPCAGVDRVFRYDIGIKSLKEITEKKLKEQTNLLCNYCGQSPTEVYEIGSKELYSESWKQALSAYHQDPKTMKEVYKKNLLKIL